MKIPDASKHYENLKQRINKILDDPNNTEIQKEFNNTLKLINNQPSLNISKEDLVNFIAQATLLKPINQAFFPDHPFFSEEIWLKLAGLKLGEK